jgi:hypothetical protein
MSIRQVGVYRATSFIEVQFIPLPDNPTTEVGMNQRQVSTSGKVCWHVRIVSNCVEKVSAPNFVTLNG